MTLHVEYCPINWMKHSTVGFLPAFGLYRIDDVSVAAGISSMDEAEYSKKIGNHVRDDDRDKLFLHNGGDPLEKIYRAAYLGEVSEYFGDSPVTNRYIRMKTSLWSGGIMWS